MDFLIFTNGFHGDWIVGYLCSGDEADTLFDVSPELGDGCIQECLLIGRNLGQGVNLAHTLSTKLDIQGKVVQLDLFTECLCACRAVSGQVDIGGLDQAGLSSNSGFQDHIGEAGTCKGHREGGRTSTVLGLDDLITTVLNSVSKGVDLLLGQGSVTWDLGQNRNDGHTRVTSNDSNAGRLGVNRGNDLRDESGRANNIQGADTKEPTNMRNRRLGHILSPEKSR